MHEHTAFVTGATSGFGFAIAKRLANAGARVVVAGRRHDRLEALSAELDGLAHPLELDISDRSAVETAIAELPADFRNLTILVNNAGFGTDRGPAQMASLDDWSEMIDTNIKGLLYCTHGVLGGMIARGRGHIVNIGSIAARASGTGSTVYGATKAFVLQFSKNLKSDLIGTGVRTSYIAPGAAHTEFSLVRWSGDKARAEGIYAGYEPLQANDIADAVLFALNMPAHVDVTELELMPHAQGFGPRIFSKM